MKNSRLSWLALSAVVALAVSVTASSFAHAEHGPNMLPNPGAPNALTGDSLALVEAVVAHADLLDDAFKWGDQVLAASVNRTIESTIYTVAFGTCTVDPAFICSTRGLLEIHRGYQAGHGEFDTASVREVSPGFSLEKPLRDTTPSVVEALANVAKETALFGSYGNRLTVAQSQFVSPSLSRFVLANQHCGLIGGDAVRCIGGSRLMITATTTRFGVLSRTTYQSRLLVVK